MKLDNESSLYIGLISGTSMDAVDCVLVDFQHGTPEVIDFLNFDIPPALKSRILSLCENGENQVHILGEVDVVLGKLFAKAVLSLLERNSLSSEAISAIGSHGQTIRHQPPAIDSSSQPVTLPYTLQIADPNIIAALTNITTVADFRRKDIAIGGQGAPLVPAFHSEVFSSAKDDRIIVNIGGISNVTLLKKNGDAVTGFDTGPGNVLMDLWIYKHKQQAFDDNGDWADSGTLNNELLQNLLNDNYFHLPPPKSTGRELFNWQWLNTKLESFSHLAPQDVQATLLELTTSTICDSISPILSSGELIVCGGGARNGQIILSLKNKLEQFKVSTSSDHGLDSDSVEAVAFAWLAKQTIERKTVDYTRITGASHPIIMGGIYSSE